MSYILGGLTLPQPKNFKRQFVEVAQSNSTITGVTTKRVTLRKEVFTLAFENLTQAQVNSLMSLYELQQVMSFEVTEENLPIGPTDVMIELPTRKYPKTGREYRENLSIILTEIK